MFQFSQVQLKEKTARVIALKALKWSGSEWVSTDTTSPSLVCAEDVNDQKPVTQLTCLTFNLMKENLFLPERSEAFIKLLQKYKPHFVALQVKPSHVS